MSRDPRIKRVHKSEINIELPEFHAVQQQVFVSARRFNVLDCGRRLGKTELAKVLLMLPSMAGFQVAYVTPTYKMLAEVWRAVVEVAAPMATRIDSTEKRIELIGGGIIDFFSSKSIASMRGRKYKRVLIDEAAMDKKLETAWNNVIRPLLSDLKGDAWFLSTPDGYDYFFELWKRGQSEEFKSWMSWQIPTAVIGPDGSVIASNNPYISPAELEAARMEMPSKRFAQEYLALFTDRDGAKFERIWFPNQNIIARAAVPANLQWKRYFDLAISTKTTADYTASAAVAVDLFGNLYIRDMFRGHWDAPTQMKKIKAIMLNESAHYQMEFGIEKALHGAAILQQLFTDPDLVHLTFRGIDVSDGKVERSDPWAARAEQRKVFLVQDDASNYWISEFLQEVCSFTGTKEDLHDDQVDTISGGARMAGIGIKKRNYGVV